MAGDRYFGPGLFEFLRELKANNDRAWFQANRKRFEAEAREPALRFIADFQPLLDGVNPHFVADPRPVGGSLFRIHRDTRFARDKSPYKTHLGLHFRHEGSTRDVHGPGFYLHLEPDGCFGAGGLWHPGPEALQRIREAIVDDPAAWEEVVANTTPLEGESLKRAPQGFDPRHPFIEDLKRKDFITATAFSEAQACSPGFMEGFAEVCRGMGALMAFLTRATGFAW